MEAVPALAVMGRRIIIMGPSNAGKSTLAVALGRKLGIEVVHLDLLRHLPDTDWVQRSNEEFARLHDGAIAADDWVAEGNYSELLPQRLARATGFIVIDDHVARRYWRYFWRTISRKDRAGGMAGNRDSLKWEMIHWIWVSRHSTERYRAVAKASGLPQVSCQSLSEVKALYEAWGLERRV